MCSAEPPPHPLTAPQEVNSQTAASLLLPQLLPRPWGKRQPLPSILTTHAQRAKTRGSVRADDRLGPLPSVWVLTWKLDTKAVMKVAGWNRESTVEILIRSDAAPKEMTTTETSISSAQEEEQGDHCQLSDTTSSPRQIRTGNTVPCSPNNKAAPAQWWCCVLAVWALAG